MHGIKSAVVALALFLPFAVSAQTEECSAQKLTLVQTLSKLDGSEQAILTSHEGMEKAMRQNFPMISDELSNEIFRKFIAYHDVQGIMTDSRHIVCKTLSEAELRKSIEFYQSPEGKTIARKMPELTRQATEMGTARGRAAMERTMQELQLEQMPGKR